MPAPFADLLLEPTGGQAKRRVWRREQPGARSRPTGVVVPWRPVGLRGMTFLGCAQDTTTLSGGDKRNRFPGSVRLTLGRGRRWRVGAGCYRQARGPPVAGEVERFGLHREGRCRMHQTRCVAGQGQWLRLVPLRAVCLDPRGSQGVRVRFRHRNGWWCQNCHRPLQRVGPEAYRSDGLGFGGPRGHWDAPMSISSRCGKKKGVPQAPLHRSVSRTATEFPGRCVARSCINPPHRSTCAGRVRRFASRDRSVVT